MSIARTSLVALIGVALMGAVGCSTMETRDTLERVMENRKLVRVKPWERDLLSRRDMAWQPDKLQAARRAHIAFSKEATLGGGSVGGGGCGCN
jgi:hypothetical protein